MTDIDIVYSGSGTLAMCHAGATAVLRQRGYVVARTAGTSGGGIVAAGVAHGLSDSEMLDLSVEFGTKDLLDLSWAPWVRMGFFKGDRIHGFLREHFPGKMGDAALPWGVFVVDLDKRRSRFLNSWDDADVTSADALRATVSVPFFFKAVRIEGLGRKLFVDGGVARNFGIGIYDGTPRKTVGITFRTENYNEVRVGTPLAITNAVVETLVNNINNTPPDGRHEENTIKVYSSGNSMDFTLSKSDVLKRYNEGKQAAEKWCDAQAER